MILNTVDWEVMCCVEIWQISQLRKLDFREQGMLLGCSLSYVIKLSRPRIRLPN